MLYLALADLIVLLHLGFILFVVLGGLLVFRWRGLVWLHVPAVLWGALVELAGWICPLTPLEAWLRRAAGAPGYSRSFVDQYLVPVVYPADLTREIQILLGLCVVAFNSAVYLLIWRRHSR
jgi:hypothetical protein